MTAFDCMSEDELTLWSEAARNPRSPALKPCVDCPLEFHLAEKAAGRCERVWQDPLLRQREGRPRMSPVVVLHGRGNPYPTDEARRDARRQSWSSSKTRRRLVGGRIDRHN